MRLTVEVGGESTDAEMPEGATCMDLVLDMGLSPDITLVFHDGKPVPIDSPVEGGSYKLVSVASGG